MQLSSVKKFGKICHHHFEPSAIANDKFTFKQTLVRDAVPTILIVEVGFFNFISYNLKKKVFPSLL